MTSFIQKIWGGATAVFFRKRAVDWPDLLILVGLCGLVFGLRDLSREWSDVILEKRVIDLSIWALPQYTFLSLTRGLAAYVLSLLFTIVYGYWAAKDKSAQKVLIPLLDILQSIPVLGFLPGVVLALVAIFGNSNVGLELAAILMIFTGQVWNMTFSFYHSVRSVPQDQREVASIYRFDWWETFKTVELPYSMTGLVWNSMMSMAGGWFFLMINESFVLGERDYRLPGLGSYMSAAVAAGDWRAQFCAIFAMVLMIVALDQFFWRPLVVWAQKFRLEESAQTVVATSWFLDWLQHSQLFNWIRRHIGKLTRKKPLPHRQAKHESGFVAVISHFLLWVLIVALLIACWPLLRLLATLPATRWRLIGLSLLATLGRVLVSTFVGTLWALPAGIAIGLSPKLARILQPVVQVAASFPAPMLFPLVVAGLKAAHIDLNWGSIALMLLGTQWYILFNVVAGATAIPGDLKEAAQSFSLTRWQRFWKIYAPSCFPYLVTGWVTAAGGAWNASIVSEYVTTSEGTLKAFGIGAQISEAAAQTPQPDYAALAASILAMASLVVVFNRLVWKPLYHLAETRFSLAR